MKSTYVLAVLLSVSCMAHAKGGSSSGGHHQQSTGSLSSGSTSEHHVSSYVKQNGTHVDSHQSTNANSTKLDNWTTKGNVNPYTGKEGTKSPY
jgi:hypothetical protein